MTGDFLFTHDDIIEVLLANLTHMGRGDHNIKKEKKKAKKVAKK